VLDSYQALKRIYDGVGSGLALSWENIHRGVAYDGSVLMRRYNRHAEIFSNRWIVKTWPENFIERGRMIVRRLWRAWRLRSRLRQAGRSKGLGHGYRLPRAGHLSNS
jgi:hypothetical protein